MEKINVGKILGGLAGLLVFAVLYVSPAPEGLNPLAWKTVACAALMIIWWVTESLPIPVTSLLPIILFPLLGISDIKQAATPYGSPMVFLFLGGFIMALAMERWNLHTRIALSIVRVVGTNANGIIGGFMIATGFISMWMSNTATTVMMLPIAISVIDLIINDAKGAHEKEEYEKFFTSLMLGIAYAASLGGMGTLIGTPPNMIFAGYMREHFGYHVSFLDWMMVGVPVAVLMIGITWVLLTQLCFRTTLGHLHGSRELITQELKALGPMALAEKMVLVVFCLTAALWILRSLFPHWLIFAGLSDESIALIGAFLLFILPANKRQAVMDWKTAEKLPWGILLLFGGGLSLAAGLESNGAIAWLGDRLALMQGMDFLVILLVIVALVVIMSEFMSNMALTAVFLPIAGALALGFHENPLMIALPITLAASCGFMLPMATPPNALVFGSGHVTIPRMVKAGALLDVISIVVVTFVAFTLLLWVFGIERGVVPGWALP